MSKARRYSAGALELEMIGRPESDDTNVNILNDLIDKLESASKAMARYRETGRNYLLNIVRSELESFREPYKKVQKRRLPELGKKTLNGLETWYNEMAREHKNAVVRKKLKPARKAVQEATEERKFPWKRF